jgi:hypothetical protein
MAQNSPVCAFIHAWKAGSCSTAPLKRSKSVLPVAPLSGFEICSCGERFPSAQDGCAAFGTPSLTQAKQAKEVTPYTDKRTGLKTRHTMWPG